MHRHEFSCYPLHLLKFFTSILRMVQSILRGNSPDIFFFFLMRFLLSCLVSSSFLVLLRFNFFFLSFFLSFFCTRLMVSVWNFPMYLKFSHVSQIFPCISGKVKEIFTGKRKKLSVKINSRQKKQIIKRLAFQWLILSIDIIQKCV